MYNFVYKNVNEDIKLNTMLYRDMDIAGETINKRNGLPLVRNKEIAI